MRLWVAIVVTLAALIRLPSFIHDGIWRDEAYVYIDVTASTFGEFLHRVTETEWHPPLYFLLEYGWSHLAGTGVLALTILPYAFSVATTGLVYLLGAAAVSRKVGLLAASMYALAPLPIEYSTEYVYPLTGALATLLAWLVTRARREPASTGLLAGIAAVSTLTAFSHYVALVFIVLLGIWSILARANIRKSLTLVCALAAGPLTFLLWLPVFLTQRRIGVPFQFPIVPLLKAWFFVKWLLEFMPARPFQAECAFLLLLIVAAIMIVRRKVWRSDAAALGATFAAMLFFTAAAGLPYARYAIPYCGLLYVAAAWAAF
ncbi:MAG TPA: glycosyltransferase family 39 protein, partial [Candidatus Baltobacteraceae bacterium]|nr:glycosyltransferase family 39 protein [Candidatus Baltobacteraceae bacterium]